MERRTLSIDGMSCGHCVARVKKTLEAVPGVTVDEVAIGTARLGVEGETAVMAAIRALDDAGYPARDAQA